ncbi:uncharacterized protein LOC110682929 [Chenopodium quinoa]|uniref:uncharacterized protein LOC110682929 n=1 Tax=Chenopodium quinoa TaxID=63459 RepID=UPI000B781597|nr:uncharacterized protein LOC110682929 [Chenopodium quinoa]
MASHKNPEKLIEIELSPALSLKQSAMCLCDHEFNPKAMGRLDITERGFEITVRNTDSKAAMVLFFKSTEMMKYHCKKPIFGKLINVSQMYPIAAKDDDILNIYHLDGLNQLTFSLGRDPNQKYYVELLSMDDKILNIPDIKFHCEVVLPHETFKKKLKQLEDVGVVAFSIGERCLQIVGKKGMTAGQRHLASFIMPHLGALQKATRDLLFICKTDQDFEGEKEELICGSDSGGNALEELEHIGTTAGGRLGGYSALSYTVLEVLPYNIDNAVITEFECTTKDTSYCAEVTDSELRKRNRNIMKAIFKTCLKEAFPSMKHMTLMVVFMDPQREVAIEICCANAEAARLARHGMDQITVSRWLFNKVGLSFIGKHWLHAKFLLKRGNCPVDVSDKFLMADPIGLLWNETDLLNEGMRGTEVFVSLVGYLGDVDGLNSVESVQNFLTNLDWKSINNFSILAAAGKIVVPGLGDFAEGLGNNKEMKQDLAV